MKTYLLMVMHPCLHQTAGWLRKLFLGRCDCGELCRPRSIICQVRAASLTVARCHLGDATNIATTSYSTYPMHLDTCILHAFRPGPKTLGIVKTAYRHGIRTAAPINHEAVLETKLRALLEDRRNALYLAEYPTLE